MSKAPGFMVFVDAFLADVTHQTCEEDGAYLHLLFAMWRRNGYVPDNDADLARITKTGRRWKRIKARLAPMLIFTDDGMITQKRLLKEWLYSTTLRQKCSENARARWNKTNDLGDATASRSHMPPSPSPSPLASSSITKSEKVTTTANGVEREFHTMFWPMYVRKVGKPAALRAWYAARKKTELATIIGGLKMYIETKPADRPWLNPATFLNQERWADEPEPVVMRRSRTAEHGRRLIMEAQNGRGEFGLRDEVGDVPAGDVSLPTTRSGSVHRDSEGAWSGQAQIAAKGTDKS